MSPGIAVVLYQPEIPPNTGNIARTCAATGVPLHLVRPLGFSIDDRQVKRAGLDYWSDVDLTVHDDWATFLRKADGDGRVGMYRPAGAPALLTTRGTRSYHEIVIPGHPEDTPVPRYLVFGPETRGLPSDVLAAWPDSHYRVPMRPGKRSLNLANTVALVVYDILARYGFPGLQ